MPALQSCIIARRPAVHAAASGDVVLVDWVIVAVMVACQVRTHLLGTAALLQVPHLHCTLEYLGASHIVMSGGGGSKVWQPFSFFFGVTCWHGLQACSSMCEKVSVNWGTVVRGLPLHATEVCGCCAHHAVD